MSCATTSLGITTELQRTTSTMAHLLHIDSSIKGDASVSRSLTARAADVWRTAHPGGTVTYRDFGVDPLPHLDAATGLALQCEGEIVGAVRPEVRIQRLGVHRFRIRSARIERLRQGGAGGCQRSCQAIGSDAERSRRSSYAAATASPGGKRIDASDALQQARSEERNQHQIHAVQAAVD